MDTKQKIDVVKSSYETLVLSLPINEIINPLYAKKVLTSTALKEIRALPLSQSKTMYLIDNFILRSLRVGIHEYFDVLVEVLINSETLVVQELGKQLKEGKVKSVEKPAEVKYDAKAAENAIRSMFMVLIDGLPTDSLMPALIEKRVVTTTNKEKMDSMSSQIEKTVHLLNKIVIPSLKAKVLLAFEGFLEAVKESEELVCKSLAKDLSAKAGKVKVPLPKMIPPSDDAGLERYLTGSLPEGVADYNAKEQWIYAICLINYTTVVNKQSAVVSATGFVGTLTLKGERMVVLVTNNHVFQTLEQARSATYQFGYQSGSEKWQPKKIPGEELIVDNKSFFFTHHQQDSSLKWLDYTVVKVYERRLKDGAEFVSKLDGISHSIYDCIFDFDKQVKSTTINEIVSVYHHPYAKVLQKSTQRSVRCEYLLFYLCDTEEGSSGAPVVKTQDKHRYVIALHRGWKKLNGNSYNYGTLMSTIVDHIQGTDPSYFGGDDDIVRKIENAGIPT